MKIAFLTAGGIAPCLSSSIASLIYNYSEKKSNLEFVGYLHGYKGLLLGKKIKISKDDILNNIKDIYNFGGTFLGNSRVKLSNVQDCISNGYIDKNEDPLKVASNQLIKDKIDVLHTIGGDDTNTTAAELVKYLESKNYKLTVVGLPKTIDNDIHPISQTLGAYTAGEQTANFFKNIINENTTSSRQLIIHEVMGRNCGWLTAYSANFYQKEILKNMNFISHIGLSKEKWSVHSVYIPEIKFDLNNEVKRLKKIMNKYDSVNIFLSEGAGIENIVKEKEKNGEAINKDAFGHYRLDEINPGKWYAKYFKDRLDCHKVLVQKSGYYARSSSPNKLDLKLIEKHAKFAVKLSLKRISGVVGIDDKTKKINCIPFDEIKGNKPFDISENWFVDLLNAIGQN